MNWEVVPDEKSTPHTDADGVERWRLPIQKVHREGGPAFVSVDGSRGLMADAKGISVMGTSGWDEGVRLVLLMLDLFWCRRPHRYRSRSAFLYVCNVYNHPMHVTLGNFRFCKPQS